MRFKSFIFAALSMTLMACGASADTGRCPHGLKRMVLFGDSVGFGYGVGNEASFGYLAASAMQIPLTNHSVSGHTSAQTLSVVNAQLNSLSPSDFVVIETGGNDFLRNVPDEQIKANIEQSIVLVRSKTPHVALMGVPFKSSAALVGLAYDHPMYQALASKYDLIFVKDIFSQTLSNNEWKMDPIHPNVLGHQVMAQGFLNALVETCQNRPAIRN